VTHKQQTNIQSIYEPHLVPITDVIRYKTLRQVIWFASPEFF
jgi:hypothetical protein